MNPVKTILQSAGGNGSPIEFSRFRIGRAQIRNLAGLADKGDSEALEHVVELAVESCRQVQLLFQNEKIRTLLEAVARRRDQFPALVDQQSTEAKSDTGRMIRALPLGAGLGLVRGRKRDVVDVELRYRWIPQLTNVRIQGENGDEARRMISTNPSFGAVVVAASKLLPLSKATASAWAKVIVSAMEAEGLPIFDQKTWMYHHAHPEVQLGKRQSRDRKRVKANPGTPVADAVRLMRIKARKPTQADVRNGLRAAISGRLRTMSPN